MTLARSRFVQLAAALALVACAPKAPVRSASAHPPTLPRSASLPAPAAAATAQPAAPEPLSARPCGQMNCLAFATPQAAFEYVLKSEPRVLAVGEAHAQKDNPGIPSSTRRFAEQLLPLLSGRSKHIVIELLVANCQAKTVTGVAKAQAPVTKQQAQSNQSQFLTLGKYAQHLGIEPQALTPTCAEYESVLATGEDSVANLLTLVADQTSRSVERLLAEPGSEAQLVLIYGGALHNDLHARTGQESWSFGPRLFAATQGRYVELDLIVPEFVKDSEVWRNLPWFSAFDREHLVDATLLYQPTPGSFTLIFPKTDTGATQGL